MNSEKNPLVTLVMLSYNQEEFIQEAVESALRQDYENLQIIISDDYSSDKTFTLIEDLVKSYSGPHDVVINRNEENLGLANHYNKVIEMAEADIVVVAAGDDICFINKVSLLIAPMLECSGIIATHSSVIKIDINGNSLGIMALADHSKLDDLSYIIKTGAGVVAQAHAFRKSVFDFFGPFLINITNEGKVLSFRECALGKVKYIDTPTMNYRIGSGVSTYQGKDIDKITLSEPRKILSWRYTTLQQIALDLECLEDVDTELVDLVKDQLIYFERLNSILNSRFDLVNLFKIITSNNPKTKAINYFVRANSPFFLRKCYVQYFYKDNK